MIDNNVAVEGSAIYASSGVNDGENVADGGTVLLTAPNRDTAYYSCDPEPPEALGAVPCSLGDRCNLIDANQTIDIHNNNQPTDGSVIFGGQSFSDLEADGLMLRGNIGGYAIRQSAQYAGVGLTNCLVVENQFRHEVVLTESGAILYIDGCTFANDVIDAEYAFRNDAQVTITDSIIDEAGTKTLDFTGDFANWSVNPCTHQ